MWPNRTASLAFYGANSGLWEGIKAWAGMGLISSSTGLAKMILGERSKWEVGFVAGEEGWNGDAEINTTSKKSSLHKNPKAVVPLTPVTAEPEVEENNNLNSNSNTFRMVCISGLYGRFAWFRRLCEPSFSAGSSSADDRNKFHPKSIFEVHMPPMPTQFPRSQVENNGRNSQFGDFGDFGHDTGSRKTSLLDNFDTDNNSKAIPSKKLSPTDRLSIQMFLAKPYLAHDLTGIGHVTTRFTKVNNTYAMEIVRNQCQVTSRNTSSVSNDSLKKNDKDHLDNFEKDNMNIPLDLMLLTREVGSDRFLIHQGFFDRGNKTRVNWLVTVECMLEMGEEEVEQL